MQKQTNTTATETKAAELSPRAIALQSHDAAKFTGRTYAGLSKPRNSGITKAPNTTTSKAAPRTIAQLTERMHKTLSELATGYAAKPFPLIGIDRGQAAIFLASGFFIPAENGKATLSPAILAHYTAKPKAPAKAPK